MAIYAQNFFFDTTMTSEYRCNWFNMTKLMFPEQFGSFRKQQKVKISQIILKTKPHSG